MQSIPNTVMAKCDIVGDVQNVTELQLTFIKNVVQGLGFGNSTMSFGKGNDSYGSTIKRISIEGRNASLRIIAKLAPTNMQLRTMIQFERMFRNEHIMYSEVLPKLRQLEKDNNVPEDEQLKYPKWYGSLTEAFNEVILIEDLTTSNFITFDKDILLSEECIKCVLKSLAKFHSLSFVLRDKETGTYNHIKSNLKEVWGTALEIEDNTVLLTGIEKQATSIMNEYTKYLKDSITNSVKNSEIFVADKSDYDFMVIKHGDVWLQNIMFRLEKNKPTDSIMIDYQFSVVGSPVCDLIYFLFSSTDCKTICQYYFKWIDYYHLQMEKSLNIFNLNVKNVYPRERFDSEIKFYNKRNFGRLLFWITLSFTNGDNLANFSAAGDDDLVLVKNCDANLKEKVTGLIKSFLELRLM